MAKVRQGRISGKQAVEDMTILYLRQLRRVTDPEKRRDVITSLQTLFRLSSTMQWAQNAQLILDNIYPGENEVRISKFTFDDDCPDPTNPSDSPCATMREE